MRYALLPTTAETEAHRDLALAEAFFSPSVAELALGFGEVLPRRPGDYL